MRLPGVDESLVGKVCVSSNGRVGVVTGQRTGESGQAWVGMGFDGKGTWVSSSPAVTAENVADFRERLISRFGGRLSGMDT
jgi:hypothetical protein